MAKTVLILSMTPVTDEPRVRRQTAAFEKKGWNIIVCGFPGRAQKPASWTLLNFIIGKAHKIEPVSCNEDAGIAVPPQQPKTLSSAGLVRFADKWTKKLPPRIGGLIRRGLRLCLRRPLIHYLVLARFSDKFALKYYWKNFYYLSLYEYIKLKVEERPDLIIGHDYFTAPIAERLSRDFHTPFSIDIHEYASGQYMQSTLWRLFSRPWVNRMQAMYLPKSAFNSTVCEGIASLIAQDYSPLKKPAVIRSTPSYIEMPYRPAGDKIRVLYHGIIDPARGLDLALNSLPLWRPEFELILRGPGDTEYITYLQEKARTLGLCDRFRIEPPVLFNEIIPAANLADIGYFIHEDISPQKRFTLPNKFFEYIMAGIALCVSDLPEMARITRQYDLGKLAAGYDVGTVAETINSFTREDINRYKKNSLEAAKALCWEQESQTMMTAYELIVAQGSSS